MSIIGNAVLNIIAEKKALPANHGGANYASKRGANRKAELKYDRNSNDYNQFIKQSKIGTGHREANGYTKPGSRKKIH